MRSNRTLHALATRVKKLRLDRGISQEELAHRSGLSRTGMGFLETGKRWPRLDTLMSVADGLNITVDELLKGLHKPSTRRCGERRANFNSWDVPAAESGSDRTSGGGVGGPESSMELALGYEDLNDHEEPRSDSMLTFALVEKSDQFLLFY